MCIKFFQGIILLSFLFVTSLSSPLPFPQPEPHPSPQLAVLGPTVGAVGLAAVGLPIAAGLGAAGVGLGIAGIICSAKKQYG